MLLSIVLSYAGGLTLGALQAKIDQPKTDARAPTADKEADSAAESPAALAVVAQSVLQALPRGTPFPTELSALKSLNTPTTPCGP